MSTNPAPAAEAHTGTLEHEKESHLDSEMHTPREGSILEKGTASPPPAATRDITGIRWVLVVVAILSSTFLFALDNTIVADVQPAIIKSFGDISKLPWLSVSFLLGAASTNLIWGKIYTQFDAKYMYLLTVFLFEAGSAICGASNGMTALIVGRAICGVGGAGMYVGVMTLLSVTTTEHERPVYIGMTGLTWGAGTVLGPIIGGAFADSKVGWRYGFYINLFVFAICAPVYLFMLPNSNPRPGVSLKERLRYLDFVGATLIIGAFTAGVMAVAFGGIVYPWKSARIIALFIVSGILFIAFTTQQILAIFTTKELRVFPVQFVTDKNFVILFAMTACSATAIFIPIYFIPIFFQFVKNDSALEAGVRLLPFVVFLVVMCLANGGIMSATGYYMPWYLVGAVLTTIGAALMYTVDESSSPARIYGYTIILGFGAGCFVQASFSVAQAKAKPHEIPEAIGFITCAQVSGVTISLAIANSIFLNQSAKNISHILPGTPQAQIQSAIAGAGSTFFGTLAADVQRQVLHIIIGSVSRTYILAITGGALATVLSLFMKREKIFLAAPAAG